MFRCYWMVLVLCFGAVAFGQTNPEADKLKTEARAAYDLGDFQKSKDILSRILAQNPKDHAALYLRASSRVELGAQRHDIKELREGIEDARESLKLGGGAEVNYYLPYLFGMISLANIEGKKEHINVALDVAKTVLGRTNLTPEQRANILYQRASAHLARRDIDSAIDDYQEAIKIFPSHMGAYMGLAQCFIDKNLPDKAIGTFNAAVTNFPEHHLVYNNRGLYLQRQGKSQEALSDFNKAIELDKNFALAYTNRGFTYQGLGNLQAAEADFTRAIAIDSGAPLFYSLRGTSRLSQGNASGALEDYMQAIRLFPQNPVAQADVGFAKFFSKDYDGAYSAFDQANQMDPEAMRFLSPWRVWALVLANKSDAVDEIVGVSLKKEEKDRDWIDQQVLFLNGKISEKDLVEFVNKTTNEKMKNAQLCEAYYFIGERRVLANDKEKGMVFYQFALKQKEPQLSAYRGAQFALQSFGK